jgi:hypothetical protein
MIQFDPNQNIPPPETVIWRYLDDVKFHDLLVPFAEQAIWNPPKPGDFVTYRQGPGNFWLSHPYSLNDPWEASLPLVSQRPLEYVERTIDFMKLNPTEAEKYRERFFTSPHELIREGIVLLAQLCGVSCWTTAEDDEDMWGMFGGDPNGVAIRSTCLDVYNSLAFAHGKPKGADPRLCEVIYVDHKTHFTPFDGFPGILALVQGQFHTEREIRFLAKSAAYVAIPMKVTPQDLDRSSLPSGEFIAGIHRIVGDARAAVDTRVRSGVKGFHLPVELTTLINEVMIQPESEPEYEKKVRDALALVGLDKIPITRSKL